MVVFDGKVRLMFAQKREMRRKPKRWRRSLALRQIWSVKTLSSLDFNFTFQPKNLLLTFSPCCSFNSVEWVHFHVMSRWVESSLKWFVNIQPFSHWVFSIHVVYIALSTYCVSLNMSQRDRAHFICLMSPCVFFLKKESRKLYTRVLCWLTMVAERGVGAVWAHMRR